MKIYILRGASGSGKSTWVRCFLDSHKGQRVHIIEEDAYYTNTLTGVYHWDLETERRVREVTLKDYLMVCLTPSIYDHLIIDGLNTQAHEIAPYYMIARALGLDAEIITLKGDHDNAHKVPPSEVERHKKQLAECIIPDYWLDDS